jgi:hypothetical protein
MKTEEQKIISEHLINAMNREDLRTRDTAKALNLNPCYISMAKSPKSWDAMGLKAWFRLEQWHNSRGKISEFTFPADEPIWKPKEKTAEEKVQKKPKIQKVTPPPAEAADRIESHKDPDNKVKSNQSGIRNELITELKIRGDQLTTELTDISKLLSFYQDI